MAKVLSMMTRAPAAWAAWAAFSMSIRFRSGFVGVAPPAPTRGARRCRPTPLGRRRRQRPRCRARSPGESQRLPRRAPSSASADGGAAVHDLIPETHVAVEVEHSATNSAGPRARPPEVDERVADEHVVVEPVDAEDLGERPRPSPPGSCARRWASAEPGSAIAGGTQTRSAIQSRGRMPANRSCRWRSAPAAGPSWTRPGRRRASRASA